MADHPIIAPPELVQQWRDPLVTKLTYFSELAQPEPQKPTDEELYDYWISTSPELGCADPVGFARAVLARWGHTAELEGIDA